MLLGITKINTEMVEVVFFYPLLLTEKLYAHQARKQRGQIKKDAGLIYVQINNERVKCAPKIFTKVFD